MNRRFLSLVLLVVVVVAAVPVFANHAWSTYHWRRTAAQVTPPVTMNITAAWQPYASRVMSDWNVSPVIESPWSYGAISTRRRCTSTTGQIEVCNDTYGQNGWLGIAGISLSGGHIVKGYTKLNDTYYNSAQYNTPAWRRLVFCQEVGHDYGLAHQNPCVANPNASGCGGDHRIAGLAGDIDALVARFRKSCQQPAPCRPDKVDRLRIARLGSYALRLLRLG